MRIAEQLRICSGVVIQAAVGFRLIVLVDDMGAMYRIVGSFERTFAVPSVAGFVFFPERMILRERQFGFPVPFVNKVGSDACSRHPPKVGKDIFNLLELSPVGCTVSADDGSVVFGSEPVTDVVSSDGFNSR